MTKWPTIKVVTQIIGWDVSKLVLKVKGVTNSTLSGNEKKQKKKTIMSKTTVAIFNCNNLIILINLNTSWITTKCVLYCFI